MTEQQTETDWAEKIGKPAYESIAEMVAAIDEDAWTRLDELREERDTWVENDGGDEDEQTRTADEWAKEFPEESEELADLETMEREYTDREGAETRIQEDALDITIRGERRNGEWEADEFTILLATGGPAVRIKGELSDGEPCRAWLEVQDWYKPWTQYFPADQDTLLTYCRQFCFE